MQQRLKISERVYRRRRIFWQDVADRATELVGTILVAATVTWFVINALFPNTPL